MICPRCLFTLARNGSGRALPSMRAAFSSIPARSDAAEPFTIPAAMSPSARAGPAPVVAEKKTPGPSVVSSIPAGTVLKGINIYKDKQDPVAMEDHEYPDWLWGVLDEIKGAPAKGSKAEAKLNKKSKKSKRGQDKVATAVEIPIHQQSIDLPVSDGSDESIAAYQGELKQITMALRAERRAKIKEDNFLRGM
ncbi:hypothetical protein BT63DRAFT_419528, partial [Microthyrium microscopicum]